MGLMLEHKMQCLHCKSCKTLQDLLQVPGYWLDGYEFEDYKGRLKAEFLSYIFYNNMDII